MPAYQDAKTKKWYCKFYFKNWQGELQTKMKRGFTTKRDALAWEREFKQCQEGDLTMTFAEFMKLYEADRRPRLKLHTWISKEYMINDKLMPYFEKKAMNQIKSTDIIKWQNELMNKLSKDGKPYSATYLKTINNQLTAIFNHAIKYYDLKVSPMAKVGAMGEKHAKEMLFWTREEYGKFADTVQDEPQCYYAFEVLYWCGIRLGEMLALTFADVDMEAKTVTINKSYQRLREQDVITPPKTKKSKRVISIPKHLCNELEEYKAKFYKPNKEDRMFTVGKHKLRSVMEKAAATAGIKRIRVHDLRHSHVSLLIDMGFSPIAIADRLGHESIEITFRYAHLFPSKQTEMAEKLNASMAAAPDKDDISFSVGNVINLRSRR